MSARQYTVFVKVKGDDTFRKIEQLEEHGLFKKLESLASNQMVQLGGIAAGIGGPANQVPAVECEVEQDRTSTDTLEVIK